MFAKQVWEPESKPGARMSVEGELASQNCPLTSMRAPMSTQTMDEKEMNH